MDECKFCRAAWFSAGGGVMNFACGTYYIADDDKWAQDRRCANNVSERDADELARYRAMFPVDPWSTGPITPEVCERLGMVRDGRWWSHEASGMAVFLNNDDKAFIRGGGYGKNSGQLACLIAARKTTTEQPLSDLRQSLGPDWDATAADKFLTDQQGD